MVNLTMLVACLVAGILLRTSGRVPDNAHATLNAVIVHVALPAVTLRHLHGFRFDASHLAPVAMPWLLFALGAAVFWAFGRWQRWPRATVGALTLVGGLGNTSFVGLPMIESLHGRDGLALGLLIDQLGSYLVLSTAGVALATWYAAEQRPAARAVLRKVATFPPFIALVAALLLAPLPFPPVVEGVLDRIGATLAPLALLSVGMQLRTDALRLHARALGVGLGYKLVVCPAVVLVVLLAFDVDTAAAARVSLIEAAMPPMIGAAIVAANAKLNPGLVSGMVGVGVPLGIATSIAWHGLLCAVGG